MGLDFVASHVRIYAQAIAAEGRDSRVNVRFTFNSEHRLKRHEGRCLTPSGPINLAVRLASCPRSYDEFELGFETLATLELFKASLHFEPRGSPLGFA